MEETGETVNASMLVEKWKRFEEWMNVTEAEQLTGEGWITPFKKAWKIKEFQRHREAGSVDLRSVEEEHKCVQKILMMKQAYFHCKFPII